MTKSFREWATQTRQSANLAPLCMPLFDIYFNGGIANGVQKVLVALLLHTNGGSLSQTEFTNLALKVELNGDVTGLGGGSTFLHTTKNNQI